MLGAPSHFPTEYRPRWQWSVGNIGWNEWLYWEIVINDNCPGSVASVESKIFPHILLLCSILLLLQWSDNKPTLHKTTTRRKMYFVSFCSRFIDRFAPCVLFRSAMWAHQFTVTLTCTNANETVAIDVLVVVYNKTWENRVMLSLHGQLVLDIRPRCWLRMLKLTRLRLVNFYHPQSTSLPNIQHYLIMTRWITLQKLALIGRVIRYLNPEFYPNSSCVPDWSLRRLSCSFLLTHCILMSWVLAFLNSFDEIRQLCDDDSLQKPWSKPRAQLFYGTCIDLYKYHAIVFSGLLCSYSRHQYCSSYLVFRY